MANAVVYGFQEVQNRFGELVTAVGVEVVNTAITQAMAEHNRQMALFTGLFLNPGITEPQRAFRTMNAVRNQPLDEAGRPIPIRGEAKYTLGFPYADSGQAIANTWLEARKMRVEDVNRRIAAIQDGDRSYVFDHILAALFNNVDFTFSDPENGDLTVKPIANGDAQVYQVPSGAFAGGTDNHFFAQANPIAAGADNPFPGLYAELTEHPENGGQGIGRVISFINSAQKASVQGLATFEAPTNPDLTLGIGETRLTGTLGVPVPGIVLGMEASGIWVVEWPRVPAGYMITLATGGEPPIGERVDPDTGLRGFIEIDGNEDFPWYQRNWFRRVGYGAWNRVAAAVTRIGNGTYAVPTGYGTPMY